MVRVRAPEPPVDAQLVAYVGEGITCECSLLITQEYSRWPEITERTLLEALEDRLIRLVTELLRELVAGALVNKDDEDSVS